MTRLAAEDDRNLMSRLAILRRSIALDRYGVVAHVLAERDGCTAETCDAFAWIGDPAVLRTNLRGRVFDTYVARYASSWDVAKPAEPVAPAPRAAAPQAEAAPAEPAKPGTNFAGRYDFPSAASIPPVSIMAPEPGGQQSSGTASSEAAAVTPTPPRRPTPQRAARPAPANPPTQLVPPAPSAPLPGSTGAAPRPQ
jgi:hypothetical protein